MRRLILRVGARRKVLGRRVVVGYVAEGPKVRVANLGAVERSVPIVGVITVLEVLYLLLRLRASVPGRDIGDNARGIEARSIGRERLSSGAFAIQVVLTRTLGV